MPKPTANRADAGANPEGTAVWHHETEHGRWTDNALRLFPHGAVEFAGIPRRGYSILVGGRIVGALRRHATEGWIARIDGFEWRVLPGMGSGRFGIKWTAPRLFATANEARKAIRAAIAARPAAPEGSPVPDADSAS